MPTKRTTTEAKAYISESIELWEKEGTEKQIISLSNWAERWRTLSEIKSKTAQIETLKKDNKSLELIIKRNKKIGVNYPVIDMQLQQNIAEIKELESSFIKPNRKKRKIQ
jgi:hypothetical protein